MRKLLFLILSLLPADRGRQDRIMALLATNLQVDRNDHAREICARRPGIYPRDDTDSKMAKLGIWAT